MRCASRAFVLISLGLLAACAGHPRVSSIPRGGPATMRPYQVGGRWFTPSDERAYDQKGIASWYGPGFHGKSTATGEPFDQDGITAAHKTLPLPSFVEVSNLDNGRVQLVRLNDRGPFVGDRIIDLSRRTAQLLGVDRTGTARVRVRRVYPSAQQIAAIMPRGRSMAAEAPPPPKPVVVVTTITTTVTPPAAPPLPAPAPASATLLADIDSALTASAAVEPRLSYVQIAAVSDESRALALAEALAPLGAVVVDRRLPGLLRIRLGPFTPSEAGEALARVRGAGYGEARVVEGAN